MIEGTQRRVTLSKLRGTPKKIVMKAFFKINQVRFGAPANSVTSASFGRILGASSGRMIQLAVKLIW